MSDKIETANPPTLQQAAGGRRPVSGSEPWVIYAKVHSHGEVYWWRPGSKGYTRNLECAGHYTEAEARSIEKGCESEHIAIRLSDLMPLHFQRVLDLGYGHNGETFKRILAQNDKSDSR